MYRKILIIFISVFFTLNVASKALIVLLVLGVSIYLQSTRKPFVTEDLNELELRSTVVSLSTIYFALFNYMTDAELTKVLMMGIVVLTNAYFLYYLCFKMVSVNIELLRKCLKFCPVLKDIFDKTLDGKIEKTNIFLLT